MRHPEQPSLHRAYKHVGPVAQLWLVPELFFNQASAKWNIGVLDEVVWVPLNVFLIKG